MRSNSASPIPAPVSEISITAQPSSLRVLIVISLTDGSPSMACAALTSKLRNTWPSRVSSPLTREIPAYRFTKRARWRTSFQATRIVASSTASILTGSLPMAPAREKSIKSLTIWRTRSAPSRALSRAESAPANSESSSPEPSRSRVCRSVSSRRPISRLPSTYASGLLISCAMPAASVPSETMRSVSARLASTLLASTRARISSVRRADLGGIGYDFHGPSTKNRARGSHIFRAVATQSPAPLTKD